MKKILVIGAGAMGSAFTVPCVDNHNNVVLIGTHLENEVIDKIIGMLIYKTQRSKSRLINNPFPLFRSLEWNA